MNVDETKHTETIDGNQVTIKIPPKFAVSKVPGEDTIDNGLVVIDENGNEFVWIPCTKEEYNKLRADQTGWITKQNNYSTNQLDGAWQDSQTVLGASSIEKNGGFYVSRYEAGIPENATGIYVNQDGGTYTTEDKKNVTTFTPVSKKNVQAWNCISQQNAITVSKKMETNGIKSYLIDGNAWDTICRKIESTGKDIMDSRTWGNYSDHDKLNYSKLNTLFAIHMWDTNHWIVATTYQKGVPKAPDGKCLELATGASDDFKAYNIYDIAGNMWEWTTEISLHGTYAVFRGGSFYTRC